MDDRSVSPISIIKMLRQNENLPLVLVLAFIMLDGMVCVGWNNVIFAPSSP